MFRHATTSNILRIMTLFVGTMILAACNEPADMGVSTAYHKGMKYEGIGSTYDWAPSAMQAGEQYRPLSPELDSVLTRIVDDALAKKGFTKAGSGTPDFYIRDGLVRQTKTDSNVSAFGVPYQKGSLFLDVLDPASGDVIWRGVAQARLDDAATPAERESLAMKSVHQLVEKFPSKSAPNAGK